MSLPSDIIRHEIYRDYVRSNPKDVALLRINKELEQSITEDYRFLLNSLLRLNDVLTEQQKKDVRNYKGEYNVASYSSFDVFFVIGQELLDLLDTKEYSWLRFI